MNPDYGRLSQMHCDEKFKNIKDGSHSIDTCNQSSLFMLLYITVIAKFSGDV